MSADGSRTAIATDDPSTRRLHLWPTRCTGARACGASATTGREKCARVLHVSPSLFGSDSIVGGGERAAYGLARGVAREIPTTLVSFGAERASQQHEELESRSIRAPGIWAGSR